LFLVFLKILLQSTQELSSHMTDGNDFFPSDESIDIHSILQILPTIVLFIGSGKRF
jgi:hypothetical protein